MCRSVHPTRYYKIDPEKPQTLPVARAAQVLRKGGLVAFPTETVYGLGANALDARAVQAIFTAKGRPADNPLIVHVAGVRQVRSLVRVFPQEARQLAREFWPGPLTLILPRKKVVPDVVTAGLETVAVRIPCHPVALALLKKAAIPVAAPSANRSGRPSPTTGLHVLKDLAGRVDVVLDGGQCAVGVESTVLDLTTVPPLILRPGGVTREQLEKVLGTVEIDPAQKSASAPDAPRSPGMKYTHYTPKAQVYLAEGSLEEMVAVINSAARQWHDMGKTVAVLATGETERHYRGKEYIQHVEILGTRQDLSTIAGSLFHALRSCDRYHADIILAETFPDTGLGAAIMNRLSKAAGYKVIK